MGFLAVIEQGARAYPALLPIALVFIALMLWACDHKRWFWATTTGIIGCAACVLYIASPAAATDRPIGGATQRGVGPIVASTGTGREAGASGSARDQPGGPLADPGRFSSTVRMHPRFPRDFPIPRSFRLESNSGGTRSGNVTVRFRFSGEAANAVCDLQQQCRANGWSVEILAPHRMTFRKDGRIVDAWFSYPARSVVLDIPDNR
ncbi:MAG TPA: hypothetical protein VKF61_01565 [Candidatus Polarisedimenticolia bacterium]|nr:hypothetical protein [Candidatus Polarisedimenticolia bacterium]